MKLPEEAWLEFAIEESPAGGHVLRQRTTFRPQGLLGRLYGLAVLPFHWLLFPQMARNLAAGLRLAPDGLQGTLKRDP